MFPHIPGSLFTVLQSEFEESPRVYSLFNDFFQHEAYDRDFVLKLFEIAKGRTPGPWKLRRLATLMLEHHIGRLSVDDRAEFDFIFTRLNLKSSAETLNESVLKEG